MDLSISRGEIFHFCNLSQKVMSTALCQSVSVGRCKNEPKRPKTQYIEREFTKHGHICRYVKIPVPITRIYSLLLLVYPIGHFAQFRCFLAFRLTGALRAQSINAGMAPAAADRTQKAVSADSSSPDAAPAAARMASRTHNVRRTRRFRSFPPAADTSVPISDAANVAAAPKAGSCASVMRPS